MSGWSYDMVGVWLSSCLAIHLVRTPAGGLLIGRGIKLAGLSLLLSGAGMLITSGDVSVLTGALSSLGVWTEFLSWLGPEADLVTAPVNCDEDCGYVCLLLFPG